MPHSLRLLVFIWLVIAFTACGNAAPAPTPLPPTVTPQPTATPLPPTPTPPPTATLTPTPGPLDKAAAFVAVYAPTTRVNGGLEITLPWGEKVVLHEVKNEKMEAQNWVENYNDWQVVAEGQDEQGRTWRVIENAERGETALAYDNQLTYNSSIFPYTVYSLDKETGRSAVPVEAPGNSTVEDLHVHQTEEGKWVDDEGNEVTISDFMARVAERAHLKDLYLQRVTMNNWEVMALVDKGGNEWAVREGKLWQNGQEVAMPEVVGEAKPTSLALRAEDGKWYVMDERGLARWVMEKEKVAKYRRPVEAFAYIEDPKYEEWLPGLPEKMAEIARREFDYSAMRPIRVNGQEFRGGLLGMEEIGGVLGFEQGNRAIWVSGLVVEVFDQLDGKYDVDLEAVIVLPMPFQDLLTDIRMGNDERVVDRIRILRLKGNEWNGFQDDSMLPEELRSLWQKSGGNLAIVYGASFPPKRFWGDEKYREWEEEWLRGEGNFAIKRQRLVILGSGN